MSATTNSTATAGIDRRTLLTGAAVASAAVASGFLAHKPTPALAADEVTFDEECDVLVIGSGYSGMAAAYEAGQAGANVKIVEKLGVTGGNSMVADGDFAVCMSDGQKAMGIEDSIDAYVYDMQVAGLFLNDVEKCRVIAEKSNETWEWTRDVLGTEWQMNEETGEAEPIPYGGHTILRTLHPVTAHGASIIMPLQEKLSEMGIEIQTNTMLANLVKDESGRVVGAELRTDCSDNDPTSGEPLYVKALRGVVLASGGFGRDVAWREVHDPRLGEEVDCTNAAGATAESLCTAMDCGAMPVHLDWIQCGPWCSPDEPGYGVGPTWIDSVAGYAPSINPLTGERCVDELTDRKRYCDVIFEVGVPLIQVTSDANVPDWSRPNLEKCIEAGVSWQFDTLEEIAEQFDMPKDAFLAQMEAYNGYVEAKNDEQFGKAIPEAAVPIDTPPFYATRLWPKVHHCMGGVKTDTDCRVLDVRLQPIPGLYAAGEVTGGIHGACRLGSCATADCLVNGRIAGQQAAANDPVA